MTYETFKTQYETLLAKFLSYEAKTIGCNEYASKLADLCEAYPEFEKQYDDENN
jgi:hypothetical protein